MPLIKHITTLNNNQLFIWEITENIQQLLNIVELTAEEQSTLNTMKSERRKKEFLGSRLLLQQYFDKNARISHNQDGKPFIENSNVNISITHTQNYIAIFLSSMGAIALDMEHLSDRVTKIAHRFLSEKELENISSNNKILHLYQYWCTKECLIKFYGKKNIHLTKELKVYPFDPTDSVIKAAVLRADFKQNYSLYHLQINNCLLVYGEAICQS